ncbi:MAG: sugar phosphate isomerase/epimerase [Phycisphaerales bacterium]|nr:sugar phosphate isomerase/epimerase [Phycisphaerales bacterium]
MKIAVRDEMVPVAPGKTIYHSLRELGIDSIEIDVKLDGTTPHVKNASGNACSIKDAKGVQELTVMLGSERMRACALLLSTDFSSNDADKHVECSVKAVHAAKELGCPVVRIDTATRNEKITKEQSLDLFIRHIRQVLDQTKETGVDLGIENHGTISNDPKYLEAVFAAVGDERLGMTLDTGNFYWYGHPLEDLYKLLERFAPKARHTHVKNINYPKEMAETKRTIGYEYGKYCSPLDEGNISMKRVVEIFKMAGYTRDLCIENEALGKYPEGERLNILRRDVEALKMVL